MARVFTKNQSSAIETRGHDLLVSAGAGSGKTAVLTERIIRRLTGDPDSDITRMLIVTFTKAAASELKERISGAISAALAVDPSNKRLSRQLFSLDRAKICTIHSFCLDLLREFFNEVGLSSDFRIADDTEIRLLRSALMNELIEDGYSGALLEGFAELADSLTGTKGDGELGEILLRQYDHFASIREGIEFISDFADELEADSKTDFAKSRCGEQILSLVTDSLRSYLDAFVDFLPRLEDDEKLYKAFFKVFTYEVDYIREINSLCAVRDFAGLCSKFNDYKSPRLGSYKGELDDEITEAKSLREAFKKERESLQKRFFSMTPEQISESQLESSRFLRKLYRLLDVFDERFANEKRRRQLVDFNDLERFAARLLIDDDGSPTVTAKLVGERFDEIFIDEYQDVNSLQDAIFTAVSKGNNRFMVGDVKQSIYAFRGAEPAIFEAYRALFTRIDDPERDQSDGLTIFLSDNFRCDKPIIDFTNLVSGCLFTNSLNLPYYPEDDLVHSKITENGAESGEPVHVVLIDKADSQTDAEYSEAGEAESEDISQREAECVAAEISRLLSSGKKDDGSPIKPSDIAILMRSSKAQSESFTKAFEAKGIPFYNNTSGDFFENPEVLLALCLLNVIDNPTRDIYLAGLLKSPIFGFTLDELTLIRRHLPDSSLYDALRAYTADKNFEKGKSFLQTLAGYRRKAEALPVDRLISYLYSDTDLPALVASDEHGSLRRANLTLLYEYARRFEGSSYKGLCNFIRYINDILAERATLENAKIFSESSDTVKLMTIHQSKGLEFPVVFVCGCAREFNESDLKSSIVFEHSLGIAAKLADDTGFARYNTPVRQAIARKLAQSQLEEEMRVLYVAMTRARERLYLTGLVKNPTELLDKAFTDAKRLSRNKIMQNDGYLKWILTSIEAHELRSSERPYKVEIISPDGQSSEYNSDKSENSIVADDAVESIEASVVNDSEALEAIVRERFGYRYPRSHASRLPAKLSVSELYPTVLDEDDAAAKLEATDFGELTSKLPLFMQSEPTEKSSAAERGTATHCFMQFCDFERFKAAAPHELPQLVEEECARLEARKFLSPRTAALVNRKQLCGFFRSDIFRQMTSSKQLMREFRFNVNLPACDFTNDPETKLELGCETILVQGVIDCFFENEDGSITLVDYKTDWIPRDLTVEEAEKLLIERHSRQLGYYKLACERICAKPVSRCIIYSFGLGRAVSLS